MPRPWWRRVFDRLISMFFPHVCPCTHAPRARRACHPTAICKWPAGRQSTAARNTARDTRRAQNELYCQL